MSFLSWFGKKEQAFEQATSPGSDLLHGDATQPMGHALSAPAAPGNSARKSERHERRDLLYSVVRECMTAAGLLTSTYKFKVLSLDSSGRNYLIMIDIPREYFANPTHFVDLEGAIARSAKERYDMLVTAVYWRVNEMVSSGQNRQGNRIPAQAPVKSTDIPVSPTQASPVVAAPALEDEVLAFKKAMASGADSSPRVTTKPSSGRKAPEPADFSDTVPFDNPSQLGPTQFSRLE